MRTLECTEKDEDLGHGVESEGVQTPPEDKEAVSQAEHRISGYLLNKYDKYADGGTKYNVISEPISTSEEVVDIHKFFEAMEIGERKLLIFLVV